MHTARCAAQDLGQRTCVCWDMLRKRDKAKWIMDSGIAAFSIYLYILYFQHAFLQ